MCTIEKTNKHRHANIMVTIMNKGWVKHYGEVMNEGWVVQLCKYYGDRMGMKRYEQSVCIETRAHN